MLRIKYKYVYAAVNLGTKEHPDIEQTFIIKDIPYSEENIDAAKREIHDGELEIYDDGTEETPSQLDVIEAQVFYTAMCTDTLITTE